MTDKTLTYQDVREIIKLVEEADKFGEFRLRYNDIEISLSKHAPLSDVATQAQRSAPLPSLPLRARNQRRKRRSVLPRQHRACGGKRRQCPQGMARPFRDGPRAHGRNVHCAPEPGAKPFVGVGDTIAAHETVCIIEVMKLMNALSAESGGVVRDILVSDGDTVEYSLSS